MPRNKKSEQEDKEIRLDQTIRKEETIEQENLESVNSISGEPQEENAVTTEGDSIESEKVIEELWLEKVLNHPIKTIVRSDSNNELKIVTKVVKDIIDPERDIWYSHKKKKPIIKETGTKKLISATGTSFPKVIPIEKQSDSSSKDREQVWIEATALFPDETTHEEYGVANRINCPDNISQANLPIMARKRAMHRAFYRSDYIGLFDVYDENETLDARDEINARKINELNQKLTKQDRKYKKLINKLCTEIKTEDGTLVWAINDNEKLLGLSKGDSVASYIAVLKLRHLMKKEKETKQKATEK